MTLKEYLKKNGIHPVEFAVKCRLSPATVYAYLNGSSKPHQKTAEKIEILTNYQVTVKELRGWDDR